MKYVVVVLTSVLLLVTGTVAAPPGGGKKAGTGGAKRVIERLQEVAADLDLSAGQKAAIRGVFDQVPAKVRELAEQTRDLEPRERVARFRELMADVRTQIEAQLTDTQKQAFAQKIDEARAQFESERKERRAAGDPATPKADARKRGGSDRQSPLIDRLASAVNSLDLASEQKTQVEKVLTGLRDEVQKARTDNAGNPQAIREQVRPAVDEARKAIGQILTREQRALLREKLRAERPDTPEKSGAPQADPAPPAVSPPTTGPSSNATQPAADAAGVSFSPLVPGDPAPDFTLTDTNGKSVTLSNLYKSRPLVLIFGSYTCPSFRDRAPAISRLKRNLGDSRATLLIIYTREAHPKGGWEVERNRDDKIEIPAHGSNADRLAAAKKAQKALELSDVPMALDSMQDVVFRRFGEHPNGAAIIARGGTISVLQEWFDPHAVQRTVGSMR